MVDFNNDITVGIPAADIERVSILQRRYDFIEAFERYNSQRFSGVKAPIAFIRSRLISLFLEVKPMLVRRSFPEAVEKLEKVIFESNEEKELLKSFNEINTELDKIKLTKVDFIKVIDKSDVTKDNTVRPVRYE